MSLESLYARLRNAQNTYNRNSNKISRLKSAKRSVESSKSQLSSRRNQLRGKANSQDTYGQWVGSTQKQTRDFLANDVIGEYNYYIYLVDNRLDAICDEITRLENENGHLLGVIGDLHEAINNLLNELEKATN